MSSPFFWPQAFGRANIQGGACVNCGRKLRDHDKERVYPEDGPTGSYHYEYICRS